MDNRTRREMQELERRLQMNYQQAARNAAIQNRRLIDRLTNYKESYHDNMNETQQRQARIDRFYTEDARSGFSWIVAGLILAAGLRCRNDIEATGSRIFNISFTWQINEVRRQMPQEHSTSLIMRRIQNVRNMMAQYPQSVHTINALQSLGGAAARNDIVQRLIRQIIEGVSRGESSDGIAGRIHAATNSEFYRARRIARTESHRLMSQGRYEAGKQCLAAGIPYKKRWISADDERVRHPPDAKFNHEAAHFETVEMDAKFVRTGEELEYPQDPAGSAGNVINCRCVMVTVIDTPGGGSQAYRDLVERAKEQTHTHDETNAKQPLQTTSDAGYNDIQQQVQGDDVERQTQDEIREHIRSDAVNKDLNVAHQNRHIRGSENFDPTRSEFFGAADEARKLIQQYHGTGEIRFNQADEWINKEFIVLDRLIGRYSNKITGEDHDTNVFSIHYSKRGAHIVPARRR